MKKIHKVTSVIMIPVDPKKVDPKEDHFILRPLTKNRKPNEIIANIPKETAEDAIKYEKTIFEPSETHLLPRPAIFAMELKCARCSYKSKVRMNLVRHLEFHSKEKEVPTSAPVNPVPCLEKNEKMFDKMTNLAISSHPIGRMGGVKIEKVQERNEETYPAFVPDNKRYVT